MATTLPTRHVPRTRESSTVSSRKVSSGRRRRSCTELERKDDDVFASAKAREDRLFVPINDDIQPVVAKILENYEKLVDTRNNRSAADPFVIALAQLNRCSVVTGERATNSQDRPNIPDVCSALGIRCASLLQMIRAEGWTFS